MENHMIYSAIALNAIKSKGGERLNDFTSALTSAGETLTVDQLLKMDGKSFYKTNANQTMTSAEAGFGKEWIMENIVYPELMERMKDSKSLLSYVNIKQIAGPSGKFILPGVGLRMKRHTPTNATPAGGVPVGQGKKATTASISWTADTMIITVSYEDELLEDSVVEIGSYVMSEIANAFIRSMHELLINGDVATGANTNINIIDGNTTALVDGDATDITAFDGLRKTAISRGKTVDAGANFVLENLRSARALMGLKGLDPAKLKIVAEHGTYFNLLNLTEAETMEKFGDAATVKNGVLQALDAIEIIPREEFAPAQADGTISATPANNDKGGLLLVYTDSVYVGIRRDLKTEETRYAPELKTAITGSARVTLVVESEQNTIRPTESVVLIHNI